MLLFDGPRQHHDLGCPARRQHEPSLRCAHVGQRPQHPAKPPYFDSQPQPLRFIGELGSECAREERLSRCVSRPGFAQRACQREQHRTPCQRDHRAFVTHDITAGVHDQRARRQQRFDLLEQEEPLLAARDEARSGGVQDEECAFDLGRQRGESGVPRCALRPSQRGARRLCPEAPQRDPGDQQLVNDFRRGREGRGVELGERTLRLVDPPDQEEAADLEIPRIPGVRPVAVLLERRAGRVQRLRGPARGRGRRARPRPRRRCTSPGPRALSDRRRARHVAGGPWLERGRRAAPSRCHEARGPAGRRAGRPTSMRRGDHPPRARGPRR